MSGARIPAQGPRAAEEDAIEHAPAVFASGWYARVSRLWLALAGISVAFGIAERASYVLRHHNARHHVTSDAVQLTELARKLVAAPASQSIADTIWPPGASATFALFMARDATLSRAAWFQFALSCAVPWLFAHTAYLLAGARVALFTLAFASLDFSLIHYGGFFLSEQLFQFSVALAIWCTVAALRVDTPRGEGAGARQWLRWAGAGSSAGVAWALATAFRPNALPAALFITLVLAVYWGSQRRWRSFSLLVGAALGFSLCLAPLAVRCTELGGKFCPVSRNFAMNIALGQLDGYWGIEFHDPAHPELDTGWVPPAMIDHGYQGMLTLPHSIYDTSGVMTWVGQRLVSNPQAFFERCARNALDLFRFELWPHDFSPLSEVAANAWVDGFGLLILVPGLISVLKQARTFRRDDRADARLACIALTISVLLLAAFSMGEARYRAPFDGVLILFCGIAYLGDGEAAPSSALANPGTTRRAASIFGGIAAAAVLLIAGAASPHIALAQRIHRSTPNASKLETRAAADFRSPVAARSEWNAPGSYVFRCNPECEELRLTFGSPQTARKLELSTDSNDTYQVAFYRNGAALAVSTVPSARSTGMRTNVINIPKEARGQFDEVGVTPLYGDGAYSLGHLRVVP